MKIEKGTIARTVVLVVALINQALAMFGKEILPFAEDDIYTAVTTILTLGATVWAGWKNNSFTAAAIEADKYMKTLKSEEVEE